MSDFVSLTCVSLDGEMSELLEQYNSIKSIRGSNVVEGAKSFITCSGRRTYFIKEGPSEIAEKIEKSKKKALMAKFGLI